MFAIVYLSVFYSFIGLQSDCYIKLLSYFYFRTTAHCFLPAPGCDTALTVLFRRPCSELRAIRPHSARLFLTKTLVSPQPRRMRLLNGEGRTAHGASISRHACVSVRAGCFPPFKAVVMFRCPLRCDSTKENTGLQKNKGTV